MGQSKVWWLLVGVVALAVSVGCSGSVDNEEDMSSDSGADSSTVEDAIDNEDSVSTTGDSTDNAMMVVVPVGEFIRGTEEGEDYEKPVRKIYLDEFWIDTYEITVDAYSECVMDRGCEEPKYTFDGFNWFLNYNYSDINGETKGNHPVNGVTWYQAKDYCMWVGKRLPTEAEWEKAARGTDGRKYPWGDEPPDCSRAVMVVEESGDGGQIGCGRRSTWPVGSKPSGVSPYGAHDMAGNVMEWTADWWDENYYSTSPSWNPQGPESGTLGTVRGGSWNSYLKLLRSAGRSNNYQDLREGELGTTGFRCAKSSN